MFFVMTCYGSHCVPTGKYYKPYRRTIAIIIVPCGLATHFCCSYESVVTNHTEGLYMIQKHIHSSTACTHICKFLYNLLVHIIIILYCDSHDRL